MFFCTFSYFYSVQAKKPPVGRGRKKSQDCKKKKEPESTSDEEQDLKAELFSKVAGDHEYIAMKEVPFFCADFG